MFCAAAPWTSGAPGASAWSSVTTGDLGFDLDRDLFGEIFGLSGGVGDHRSDRLADIGDALIGEDRLRHRDIIGAIEARTDRFDIAENSRGYDWHFWRRVHGEDAAARERAAHEAQYAGALR